MFVPRDEKTSLCSFFDDGQQKRSLQSKSVSDVIRHGNDPRASEKRERKTNRVVDGLLVPGIVVYIYRHGLQSICFLGEGIKKRIVLPVKYACVSFLSSLRLRKVGWNRISA